jgi:GTP cyclohydrolase II
MILPSKKPETKEAGRRVIRYAAAPIPTVHGPVELVVFREVVNGQPDPHREHVAVVIGQPGAARVLARVHSECITSEVFGSLKCDCRDQLDAAVEAMHQHGAGVLLYLRQEGRGIGLGNKIRAYALQAEGADTIEANHQLGFETDLRTYDVAAGMLHDLGIHSVRLMTNNPEKVQGLEDFGVEVVERVPIQLDANPHSASYLETKRAALGHFLEPIRVL